MGWRPRTKGAAWTPPATSVTGLSDMPCSLALRLIVLSDAVHRLVEVTAFDYQPGEDPGESQRVPRRAAGEPAHVTEDVDRLTPDRVLPRRGAPAEAAKKGRAPPAQGRAAPPRGILPPAPRSLFAAACADVARLHPALRCRIEGVAGRSAAGLGGTGAGAAARVVPHRRRPPRGPRQARSGCGGSGGPRTDRRRADRRRRAARATRPLPRRHAALRGRMVLGPGQAALPRVSTRRTGS